VNARFRAPGVGASTPAALAAPLPAGTVLRVGVVVDVIGQGGFGVVYRVEDPVAGRALAVKEYLPAQLATRRPDGRLEASSPVHAESYAAGLRGFLDEARLLERIRHPGLVEVLASWQDLGTAYMAMPLYEGPTLERLIVEHPGGLDVERLRAIVAPLLGALETIHAAGCVHRDVSPDNVIVRPTAGAVLLDLGAARRTIGERVRATTVMLKAGYAPIEQYGDDPDCPIGPWSDVYALGALMHHAILGTPPAASPLRVMRDTREPLAARGVPGYPQDVLEAVDAAMALRPEDRPASAPRLRARLGLPDEPPGTGRVDPGVGSVDDASDGPPGVPSRLGLRPALLALTTAAVFAASVLAWLGAVPGGDPATDVADATSVTESAAAADAPPVPLSSGDSIRIDAWRRSAASAPPAAAAAPPQSPDRVAPATRAATLRLSVVPWAEVWVDGVRRGVTPPTMTLPLAPGARVVELRNPGAGTIVRRVDAKAGGTIELAHRFGAPETAR
jgi:hypothetical protein